MRGTITSVITANPNIPFINHCPKLKRVSLTSPVIDGEKKRKAITPKHQIKLKHKPSKRIQISFFEHEVLHFPDTLPKNDFLIVIIYK